RANDSGFAVAFGQRLGLRAVRTRHNAPGRIENDEQLRSLVLLLVVEKEVADRCSIARIEQRFQLGERCNETGLRVQPIETLGFGGGHELSAAMNIRIEPLADEALCLKADECEHRDNERNKECGEI